MPTGPKREKRPADVNARLLAAACHCTGGAGSPQVPASGAARAGAGPAYIEPSAWSTRCGLSRQEEGANNER